MGEVTFKVGDRVRYNNADIASANGMLGTVKEVSPTPRYRVHWDEEDAKRRGLSQTVTRESADVLVLLTPAFSPETAEAIAAYLALDAAEDPTVDAWVQELQAYVQENTP